MSTVSLSQLFEAVTRAVFQSGMSWRVVEAKWDDLRHALAGFDPVAVARLTPADVDRLMEDPRIVRNRRKLEATVENAVELVAIAEAYGTPRRYLDSFSTFDEAVGDLKRRLRFVDDLGAHYVLRAVGEPVPPCPWELARAEDGAPLRPEP